MKALSRDITVAKLQATGNTFALIDERPPRFEGYSELARLLCDPAHGVDADGLLVVLEHPQADAAMRIFNADGSEAETCGNGLRCIARYLSERDGRETLTLATASGLVAASVSSKDPFEAAVGMGRATFPSDGRAETIDAGGSSWTYVAVSLGNPHVVIFVDDVAAVDLERVGAAIASDARFAGGTNVHLAKLVSPDHLQVRHYERGVGRTQSCGSGAVACVAAAIRRGARTPVRVDVPGGRLGVELEPGGAFVLSGPAEPVFERTLAL
jgi:diaminopimelate epimerase